MKNELLLLDDNKFGFTSRLDLIIKNRVKNIIDFILNTFNK